MPSPRCPICRRVALDDEARPFCSAACRTVDLARWLDGEYRLPASEDSDEVPVLRGDEEVG